SAVLHYLKAVEATGSTDADEVIAKMKEMPTEDPIFGEGYLREDGRKIHDMYLFRVKSPEESEGPWDYYEVLATIPAERAFRPLDEGNCPLVESHALEAGDTALRRVPQPFRFTTRDARMFELLGIPPQALF